MCHRPIHVKNSADPVPCGHCLQCAMRRTMSWTLRLQLEAQEHISTDFVTLTYSEDTVPKTLDPAHSKSFIRALSRATPGPVRYFVCGEYGGKTKRPHWHALLFGARLPQRGLSVTALWPHGHVYSGEVTRQSAQYVSRYTLKTGVETDRPQIIRMSRRPGIGLPTIRRIAADMATKIPEMDYWPPVFKLDGKSYWLDKYAYQTAAKAYMDNGGELEHHSAPNKDPTIREIELDTIARRCLEGHKANVETA